MDRGLAVVAAAIVGAGVASAGASLIGSSNAASAQENAANQASATQMAMYRRTRADLLPFQGAGKHATAMLMHRLPSLTTPVRMDEATLQRTPGYQFNLTQGLKAVQNAAAARGLGMSGAALKGASAYATGLADSTYQNQFANAVTNKELPYNMLTGVASLGENAAAQTGSMGTTTAGNVGNNLIGAGNAAAAADMAGANAIGGAASSIPNALITQSLLGNGGGGNFWNNMYSQADIPAYSFGS